MFQINIIVVWGEFKFHDNQTHKLSIYYDKFGISFYIMFYILIHWFDVLVIITSTITV